MENNENKSICPKCGMKNTIKNGICSNCTNSDSSNVYNAYSLIGFIFSFFGIFSIFGLILSVIGLAESKKYETKLKGLSIAGIIISLIMLIISFGVILSDSSYESLSTPSSNDKEETSEVCVTFMFDGNEYNKECVTKGSTISKPTDPEKEGYIFLNWATHEHSTDGSEVFSFSKPIEKDYTIYAHFKQKEIVLPKFSYDVNNEYFDGFAYYIEGIVTNNRNINYNYLQIEFICYDSSGNNIGTAFDNTNNLLANQTWKFKAMFLGYDTEVDHCVYHNISGW